MYDSLLQLEGFIELDRVRAVRWARKQLTLDNWAILDTETTGLFNAELVEIAIISNTGEPLLNTLVKPTLTIPAKSSNIHGITDDMVATAPTFPEIYPQIVEVCKNNQVLIYNAGFDMSILDYCCKLHNLPKLKFNLKCLMLIAAEWYGNWNSYHKSYTYPKLPNGNHRAIGDCLAGLQLIKRMALDTDEVRM